jgi:methionyl-tRNA synthetase
MKKKYITTAIPYTNAKPHIGTAMDYLLADIWVRYQKQLGAEVILQVGTDEHGTKIQRTAEEQGVTPQQLVDDLQPAFEEMREKMNLSPYINVRTTDDFHVRRTQLIWQKLDEAGLIYKKSYEGWYCSGCEAFVTEDEYKKTGGICPQHNRPYEKVSEENYFLKVSAFTEEIKRFASERVVPNWRGKEVLALVKNGAQDVSVSRSIEKLQCGIPVPGDDSQVMYVWIDALSNYITVLDQDKPDEVWWENLKSGTVWPAEIELIGKDILRFHAVIWPAILLGLGLALPEKLMVHGFVNIGGDKVSKSLGNVISPMAIIDEYGVDAYRYYFARHIPTFEDGDYAVERFETAYNSELANALGNLVSRSANMVSRFAAGKIARSKEFNWDLTGFAKHMDDLRFDLALDEVWRLIQHLNQYIDEKKPWELNKDATKKAEVTAAMNYLATGISEVARLLAPFLPATAEKIEQVFGGSTIGKLEGVLFVKKDGQKE